MTGHFVCRTCTYIHKRNEFFGAAEDLDTMQKDKVNPNFEAAYGISLTGQWEKVRSTRADLHQIVRELEDAVSAELRS